MGKECLKCGYERTPADFSPEYECPQCGVIYAKAEAVKNQFQSSTGESLEETGNAGIKPAAENVIMDAHSNERRQNSCEKSPSPGKQISLNKLTLALAFLLIVFVGYIFAGPYLTINSIKNGIVEKDAELLSENIEFPVLRQNLKDQLNAQIMKKTVPELGDNPFAALAVGFASKMLDALVDSIVTPSGLAAAMEGKKPHLNPKKNSGPKEAPKKKDLFRDARTKYDSMSKFSIWVPDDKGGEIRFVLRRYGFSWRLVNIVIPM
jgi:hypothetical protein